MIGSAFMEMAETNINCVYRLTRRHARVDYSPYPVIPTSLDHFHCCIDRNSKRAPPRLKETGFYFIFPEEKKRWIYNYFTIY